MLFSEGASASFGQPSKANQKVREMQATLERLRQRREERGDEGGFTLIELLIVIVVLGILAAIVVFAVQNLTGQSAAAGCQSDYKTVETAAEAYKAQMGNYPTTVATLTTTPTQPGTGQTVGPWLRDVPSSSHYTLEFGTAANFYQPGVLVVTPTGGAANPAAGTAGNLAVPATSASVACTNVK
jgi:general secretion pathway protein G